jgi:hypothetical protein
LPTFPNDVLKLSLQLGVLVVYISNYSLLESADHNRTRDGSKMPNTSQQEGVSLTFLGAFDTARRIWH